MKNLFNKSLHLSFWVKQADKTEIPNDGSMYSLPLGKALNNILQDFPAGISHEWKHYGVELTIDHDITPEKMGILETKLTALANRWSAKGYAFGL